MKCALSKVPVKHQSGEIITPVVNVYLNLIGFWSYNKWKPLIMFCNCIIPLYMIIPQLLYIFGNTDIKYALEAACPVVACIVINIKTILCYWKRENIRTLIDELQVEWNESMKSNDQYMHQTIKETRKFCKIFSLVYGIWFIIACIVYSLFPIGQFLVYAVVVKSFPTNYTMDFPYKSSFPYSLDSDYSFIITYTIVMFGVYLLGFEIAGLDTLFVSLAYHVLMHLKFLNHEILRLEQYLTENKQTKFVNQKIKRIIQRHITCMDFILALEDTFNKSIMVQLATSSIVLCIVSFQFMSDFGLNPNTIKLIGYLLGWILQLLTVCWISDEIKTEALKVAKSVYEIPWYNGTVDFQRMIKMIMLRSQRPMTVTAAKFYMVSLETFKIIVMTSYSYFTLLKTVYYRN